MTLQTDQGYYWIGEVINPNNKKWFDRDANGVYGAPFNDSYFCSSTVCKSLQCSGGYGYLFTYDLTSLCVSYSTPQTAMFGICEYGKFITL